MKNRRWVLGALTLGVYLVTLIGLVGTKANATENNANLGELNHYNAILDGDYVAYNADCEGAAAIGGDLDIRGYHDFNTPVVGDPYDDNGPGIMVGGNITKAPSNVAGKTIIVSNEKSFEVMKNYKDQGKNLDIINANTIKNHINNLKSQAISRVKSKMDDKENSLVVNLKSSTIENIDLAKQQGIAGKNIIIFTSDAKEITFKMGGAILFDGKVLDWSGIRKYSKSVMWYFPNANKVNINAYAITGTLIAPNAIIDTHSGSVNGQLIAHKLEQDGGFECHNVVFNPSEPIVPEEPKPEEPKPEEPRPEEPKPEEPKPEEPKPEEPKPEEPKPEEPKPEEPKPEEPKPEEPKPEEPKPEEPKPEEPKPEEPKPEEPKPEEPKPEEPKPEEPKPEEPKPEEPTPEEPKPEEPKPEEPTPEEPKPEEQKPEESKPEESKPSNEDSDKNESNKKPQGSIDKVQNNNNSKIPSTGRVGLLSIFGAISLIGGLIILTKNKL